MNPRTWNFSTMLRRRYHLGRLLAALALTAFAIAAVIIGRTCWLPTPRSVTISAGNIEGMWHQHLRDFVSDSGAISSGSGRSRRPGRSTCSSASTGASSTSP